MDWNADPGTLYTLMLVDVDIFQPGNPVSNFFHYLATNIPGKNILAGDENLQYIPPFAFSYKPGLGLDVEDVGFNHRMVLLVFRQRARIEDQVVEEDFCSPAVFGRLRV